MILFLKILNKEFLKEKITKGSPFFREHNADFFASCTIPSAVWLRPARVNTHSITSSQGLTVPPARSPHVPSKVSGTFLLCSLQCPLLHHNIFNSYLFIEDQDTLHILHKDFLCVRRSNCFNTSSSSSPPGKGLALELVLVYIPTLEFAP